MALILFCCLPLLAAPESAGGEDFSVIPDRPAGNLLDQARWFSPAERESLSQKLEQHNLTYGVNVFVVTRAKHPPQGIETYCRKLGESWATSLAWCIVYQQPGDPAGFHVQYGGKGVDPHKLEKILKEGVQRARRENTEKDRVKAAVDECLENLRYFKQAVTRTNEKISETTKLERKDAATSMMKKKVILAGVAAVALLMISLFFLILFNRKNKITEFHFPETSWKQRYQAPHSGGSGVKVNFLGKQLK
ncbi:MAG: TPM domain-containing protein [Akkermansiaceae bacterium]